KQFYERGKILERAAKSQILEMKQRNQPDYRKREKDWGAKIEHALQVFAKRHRGECNRRGKSYCRRNKSGHEPERWVINLRQQMILASRARQCGAEFAVTKRAAKRRDASDHPEHQQSKP